MIGIPLGLAAANAAEWAFHKYVLHGLGKNPRSFWAFHWHEHHKSSRANDHVDAGYHASLAKSLRDWNGQGKEAVGLAAGAILVAPLFPVAPFFVGAMWWSTINYYRKHKRAHLDTTWAKTHLPWHYDHHMGPDQHKNWCVTNPWFDKLVGTRVKYLGTEKARRDDERRQHRQRSAALAT